jgi:hypothetical protein
MLEWRQRGCAVTLVGLGNSPGSDKRHAVIMFILAVIIFTDTQMLYLSRHYKTIVSNTRTATNSEFIQIPTFVRTHVTDPSCSVITNASFEFVYGHWATHSHTSLQLHYTLPLWWLFITHETYLAECFKNRDKWDKYLKPFLRNSITFYFFWT